MATFAWAVSYTIALVRLRLRFLRCDVVARFHRSSYGLGLELQQKNTALPDRVGLGREWTGDGKLQIFRYTIRQF
jgi:hypothetical protein